MSESVIEVRKNGEVACYAGPDATNLFKARTLAMGLKMYHQHKMLLTRGIRATDMLNTATQYTHKVYKGKNKYLNASQDMDKWCREMAAALPVVVRKS